MEPIIKNRVARERTVQKKPSESEKKKPHQLKQEEQEESTTKEVFSFDMHNSCPILLHYG